EEQLAAAGVVGVHRAVRLDLRTGVAGEVGATADETRHDLEHRADAVAARDARRDRLVVGLPARELLLPALEATAGEARVQLLLRGVLVAAGGPREPRVAATLSDLAVPGEHVV